MGKYPALFTTDSNQIINKTEKLMIEFMGIDDETWGKRDSDDFTKNWGNYMKSNTKSSFSTRFVFFFTFDLQPYLFFSILNSKKL